MEIKEITKWSPKKGDILFVKLDGMPSPAACEGVQKHIQEILRQAGYKEGEIHSLIHGDGVEFKLLRKEDT